MRADGRDSIWVVFALKGTVPRYVQVFLELSIMSSTPSFCADMGGAAVSSSTAQHWRFDSSSPRTSLAQAILFLAFYSGEQSLMFP